LSDVVRDTQLLLVFPLGVGVHRWHLGVRLLP
jgi:hypothetical protein